VRLDPRRAWRAGRRRRLKRRMAGPRLLRAFAGAYREAVFAEIGANDGEQHDFLRPLILSRRWRGVIVEPVPYVFKRLEHNYRDQPGVTLENVAVGAIDGRLPFYHLAEVEDPGGEGLPRWYDGIGSFSRDEVLSHARYIPNIESRLVETEVPCVTFQTLCERNGVERLDLLLIDAEGHDWEIIRNIDFEARMPRLLVYEHYHLGPQERRACREHLRGIGYEAMEEHFDTFCLDARPDDGLTRLWHRLEPAVPGIGAYEDGA
jgi:FkbM family methyltransferase